MGRGLCSARKVISKYELYHKGMQGKAEGLKACAAEPSDMLRADV